MEFFAGILFSWTIVEVIIALGSVVAYYLFNRNRGYLIFAAYNGFLALFFIGRDGILLATDAQQAELCNRIVLAALPLAAAALFHLAIRDYPMEERARRACILAAESIAVALAGVCLAGLGVGESAHSNRSLKLFSNYLWVVWFRLSAWGYASVITCLILVSAAGAFLAIKTKQDRVARSFFTFGVLVILALGLHDLAVASHLISSIYLAEHGWFMMTLCVLMGFLREFELSKEQLKKKTAALVNTAEQLHRVAAETRKLRPMADLGRLSASIAHEIRNPLAVLSNVTSTLQRQDVAQADSERFQLLIGILKEETDRLARLVDDLLLYASAGRVSRAEVEASSVVQAAGADAMGQLPPGSNIEIIPEVQEGLPPFSGNLHNLRRALFNLIVNAVQSSGAGGKVEVIARLSPESRDQIMIGVKDQAGGVPDEEVADIFEPFYSTRPTGTGLGLPIAKSIAEAHGGKLLLENRPGIGAAFWMCIPVVPQAVVEEKDISAPLPEAKPDSGSSKPDPGSQ